MKSYLVCVFVIIFIFISCKKNENNPAITNGLKIGQQYGGGIIFYLDASRQHGLACATTDQSTVAVWDASALKNGVYNPTPTGASATSIGSGSMNTTQIIAVLGANAEAASLCRNYRGGGYTDWFLPSEDELNQLIINLTLIGGSTTNFYWSSSEGVNNGNKFVFCQALGNEAVLSKNNTNYVRAVRAF